jgi:hypothetical protein
MVVMLGMYKRTSTVAVIFSLFFTLFFHKPVLADTLYLDVPNDYWAKNEIQFLSEKKIIKGYQDGNFGISASISRAQAAIMLVRALNLDTSNPPNPKFVDVPTSHPSYKEIATAVDEGLFAKGKEFKPNGFLTRAQMAKILVQAFELSKSEYVSFVDLNNKHWAHPYVAKLVGHKITTGYPDSTYRPNQHVTRTQFAVFLARAMDNAFKPKILVFPAERASGLYYPQVLGLPSNVQRQINVTLREHADQARQNLIDLQQLVKEYIAEDPLLKYAEYKLSYKIGRADSQYISIVFTDYEYSGGAHGLYHNTAYTFDATTGELLDLPTVAQNSNYVSIINDEITAQSYEKMARDEYYSFDGFESIDPWTSNFYLTDKGIVIYFDLYEYTSFADGIPEFLIPFELLD